MALRARAGAKVQNSRTPLAARWFLNVMYPTTRRSSAHSRNCKNTGIAWRVWSIPSVLRRAKRLRANFRITHDISAYSFPALAKAARPLLCSDASLLTLSYLGAEKVVPNYNTMGLAKASLEASVRYLAASLGARGIRVNGISAGPIKTLAASGIQDFSKMLDCVEANAPLHRNVTIEQVGNTAAFLLSDLAAGISAEIIHVDSGFHAVMGGMNTVADER